MKPYQPATRIAHMLHGADYNPDQLLDRMAENSIYAFLATPSGARPARMWWLNREETSPIALYWSYPLGRSSFRKVRGEKPDSFLNTLPKWEKFSNPQCSDT